MPDALERYVGIDLLRVAAGGGLLIAHSAWWLAPLGWPDSTWQTIACLGVEAFLVSFGFLLGARVLDNARPAGLRLPLRQLLRLWPLYALAVLVNLAFVGVLDLPAPSLPAYLSLGQNLAWPHPPFFPEAWIVAAALAGSAMVAVGLIGWQAGSRVGWGRIAWLLALIVLCHLPRAGAVAAGPDWDLAIRKIVVLRLDAVLYGLLVAALLHRYRHSSVRQREFLAIVGTALLMGAANMMGNGALAGSAQAQLYWFSLAEAGFALLLPWLCCVDVGARVARIAATLASCAFVGLLSHMTLLRFGYWLGAPMQATHAITGIALQLAYLLIAVSTAWLLWRLLDVPLRQRLSGAASTQRLPPVPER